jgi:SAM-dependent methyltransferase
MGDPPTAPIDLDGAATERVALAAQYDSGANLRSRISIYQYLDSAGPQDISFTAWVLDHVEWTGASIAADVGCGPGVYGTDLGHRAAMTIGIDLSPGMLREAGARSVVDRPLAVMAADAVCLPLADDSVDVLLAAHMLYHVTDIAAALTEFRRVIRPGGTLLVVLNSAGDKTEIRDLWQSAGVATLGSRFQVPHWGTRANLDNVPEMLGAGFDDISVDRLPGMFRFPTADPPITWIDSLRSGTEGLLTDDEWQAVLDAARSLIDASIAEHGEFRVTKDSGVVIAR